MALKINYYPVPAIAAYALRFVGACVSKQLFRAGAYSHVDTVVQGWEAWFAWLSQWCENDEMLLLGRLVLQHPYPLHHSHHQNGSWGSREQCRSGLASGLASSIIIQSLWIQIIIHKKTFKLLGNQWKETRNNPDYNRDKCCRFVNCHHRPFIEAKKTMGLETNTWIEIFNFAHFILWEAPHWGDRWGCFLC